MRGGSGKNVDVEIRGKRMRVSLKDIRMRRPSSGVPGPAFGAKSPGAGARVQGPSFNAVSMEIMLIGQTVEQAMDNLEKFVDDALMKDARILRIVHGHGTGKLREAVREFFKKHPLVADMGPAPDNQGGAGATVVTLRD